MLPFANSPLPGADRTPSLVWVAAFDAIHDGVAVVDAAGHIQRANGGFAALLGLPNAGLAGTLCTLLWGDLPEHQQPFLRAMQSGRRENIELEYGLRRL